MTATPSLASRLDRPIALVGLMGSGKSMLGRRLATKLGLSFVDTDSLVEETAGISISEIFELAGESKFREMEGRAISDIATDGVAVISTGGGTICDENSAAILTQNCVVVWLSASPKSLLSRIGSTKTRPLLAGPDPLGTLTKLSQERESHYQKAHIHLITDGLSANAAFDALLDILDRELPVK